mmetsp:Transcript_58032/g.79083  ORF Transcript_58032/g.79083 Transcript_58032/m.79083 type:complete len:254 (-) Transcript_58032:605-1366(-)
MDIKGSIRGRANSFPPSESSSKARKKKLLLHDHFPLKGRSEDPDFWRDLHDCFNLIALVPINVLNVWSLYLWYNTHSDFSVYVAQGSAEDQQRALVAFWVFFFSTVGYFLFDLAWICVKPQSVKSPNFIIVHHIVTILYLLIPYNIPQYGWCMSSCMLVEINTWFIIARRYWDHWPLHSFFFYVTWISIRLILYPWLVYRFALAYLEHSAYTQNPYNPIVCAPFLQVLLVGLNIKWTRDLYLSKVNGTKQKGL